MQPSVVRRKAEGKNEKEADLLNIKEDGKSYLVDKTPKYAKG